MVVAQSAGAVVGLHVWIAWKRAKGSRTARGHRPMQHRGITWHGTNGTDGMFERVEEQIARQYEGKRSTRYKGKRMVLR